MSEVSDNLAGQEHRGRDRTVVLRKVWRMFEGIIQYGIATVVALATPFFLGSARFLSIKWAVIVLLAFCIGGLAVGYLVEKKKWGRRLFGSACHHAHSCNCRFIRCSCNFQICIAASIYLAAGSVQDNICGSPDDYISESQPSGQWRHHDRCNGH